jgi:hypothetical protein
VEVDDPSLGASPDASAAFTLAVTDVAEGPSGPSLVITEVAPWGSGNSPAAADWFEVTNTAPRPYLTGWKVDDSSKSFATAAELSGVTSIAPRESVIFMETASLATTKATFLNTWFGASPPAALQVGGYSGSGLGLSTGGDAVNLFDATGALIASVTFGASPAGPYPTFDNTAGLNDATISQLSVVGVNGAFAALNDALEIGSPGLAPGPEGKLVITEVAPWSSGNSPVAADWFEVTNIGGAPVDLTGWKVDDSSESPVAALPLLGIASIAPGESVVFIETANPVALKATFLATWFGANPPAGLQVGSYTGTGIGLSTGGDAVNLYDPAGVLRAHVDFKASPAGPSFPTFDNAAASNGGTIALLSVAGVNGAFVAAGDPNEIGSPGTAVSSFILPSSARLAGLGGAFYTTDLTVANTGVLPATVVLKFLGNGIDGSSGPERSVSIRRRVPSLLTSSDRRSLPGLWRDPDHHAVRRGPRRSADVDAGLRRYLRPERPRGSAPGPGGARRPRVDPRRARGRELPYQPRAREPLRSPRRRGRRAGVTGRRPGSAALFDSSARHDPGDPCRARARGDGRRFRRAPRARDAHGRRRRGGLRVGDRQRHQRSAHAAAGHRDRESRPGAGHLDLSRDGQCRRHGRRLLHDRPDDRLLGERRSRRQPLQPEVPGKQP